MKRTAASTKTSVSSRPCSSVASFGSLTPHTPVVDISLAEVPFPVSSALSPSAKNTFKAVASPATTSGSILRHASDDTQTPITIIVKIQQDRVSVRILYEGAFFQPEAIAKLPSLADYPEGGFGLYLIEQSVDSTAYARHLEGRNCIHLMKAF